MGGVASRLPVRSRRLWFARWSGSSGLTSKTSRLDTQATRELHDMVAHSIGIIAIQAGSGRRVFNARPGEARDALAAIEATSRETLSGLRRAEPEPGSWLVPLGPAPGLADIDRLAATPARTSAGCRSASRTGNYRSKSPTAGARSCSPRSRMPAARLAKCGKPGGEEAALGLVRHQRVDGRWPGWHACGCRGGRGLGVRRPGRVAANTVTVRGSKRFGEPLAVPRSCPPYVRDQWISRTHNRIPPLMIM